MLNLLAGIFITIIILYFSSVCVRCGKVQTHQRRVRLLVPRTGTNEDVELDSARDTATSEMMPRFTQVVLVFPQPVVSEPPEFELLSVSIPYNYQKKKKCVYVKWTGVRAGAGQYMDVHVTQYDAESCVAKCRRRP